MPSFSICLRSSTSTSRSKVLADLLRLLAEPGRRALVAGPVAELARQGHALGDGGAPGQPGLHGLGLGLLADQRQRVRGPRRRRARLGVPVQIGGVGEGEHRGLGMGLAHRDAAGPGDGQALRAAALERGEALRDRSLERLGRGIGRDRHAPPGARRSPRAGADRASCPSSAPGRRRRRHRPSRSASGAPRPLSMAPAATTRTSASTSSLPRPCGGATR